MEQVLQAIQPQVLGLREEAAVLVVDLVEMVFKVPPLILQLDLMVAQVEPTVVEVVEHSAVLEEMAALAQSVLFGQEVLEHSHQLVLVRHNK
jgi:hypothetical protein